jgi:SAM-dependent methyltransferase
MDLQAYRQSENEKARTADLLRLLPKGRNSVLDIGARDGHFSKLLRDHFRCVTALDLTMPSFEYPGVTTVAGDVTNLQFPDNSFDCIFCAEVLEHVPALEQACREIARVAQYEIIIGVPFCQDTRVGRTTCRTCGKTNPPWGHVNEFDENRLRSLFPGLTIVKQSSVGTNRQSTNQLATLLMDMAGNPWGSYSQDERCLHCGAVLVPPPEKRPIWSRVCSSLAFRINNLQSALNTPHPNWIHVVFSKTTPAGMNQSR